MKTDAGKFTQAEILESPFKWAIVQSGYGLKVAKVKGRFGDHQLRLEKLWFGELTGSEIREPVRSVVALCDTEAAASILAAKIDGIKKAAADRVGAFRDQVSAEMKAQVAALLASELTPATGVAPKGGDNAEG